MTTKNKITFWIILVVSVFLILGAYPVSVSHAKSKIQKDLAKLGVKAELKLERIKFDLEDRRYCIFFDVSPNKLEISSVCWVPGRALTFYVYEVTHYPNAKRIPIIESRTFETLLARVNAAAKKSEEPVLDKEKKE